MPVELVVRKCNPQNPRDCAAYEQLKPGAVFAHLLTKPAYHADENLFFAVQDEVVIGYVNVVPELGIRRVLLDYAISPVHAREAALGRLIQEALQRAGEAGAKVAHINIAADDATWAELLSQLGFQAVRRFYELSLDISEADIETFSQIDMAWRYLKTGEEEMLAQIQNRCFADTWGYNPNTARDIAWWLKVKGTSPGDIILALDGTQVIGYCWTRLETDCTPAPSKCRGRIFMLGVLPGHRGKGIGRKLLNAGISHLKRKGRHIIDITVDSHNASAMALYRSFGFQVREQTIWYERVIN